MTAIKVVSTLYYSKTWYNNRVEDVDENVIQMIVWLFSRRGTYFTYTNGLIPLSKETKRYCFSSAMKRAFFDQKRGLLAIRPRKKEHLSRVNIKLVDPGNYIPLPDQWGTGNANSKDLMILYSVDASVVDHFVPTISRPLCHINMKNLEEYTKSSDWIELY